MAVAATQLLLNPAPSAIAPGSAPPGVAQPGSDGGGGSPTNLANPSAASAVALVPAGLTAVAVFPPFATPRTLPAIAVIFSEASSRRKRDIYSYRNHYDYQYDYYGYEYEKPEKFSLISDLWRTIKKEFTLEKIWMKIKDCELFICIKNYLFSS